MSFELPGVGRFLKAFGKALIMCTSLGAQIATHKTEGPVHILTFLIIELDTRIQEIWLPTDKLIRL